MMTPACLSAGLAVLSFHCRAGFCYYGSARRRLRCRCTPSRADKNTGRIFGDYCFRRWRILIGVVAGAVIMAARILVAAYTGARLHWPTGCWNEESARRDAARVAKHLLPSHYHVGCRNRRALLRRTAADTPAKLQREAHSNTTPRS